MSRQMNLLDVNEQHLMDAQLEIADKDKQIEILKLTLSQLRDVLEALNCDGSVAVIDKVVNS